MPDLDLNKVREYSFFLSIPSLLQQILGKLIHGLVGILTTLSYLTDVHALLCSHKAEHREHHKARKEAGSTVNDSE